MTTRTIDGLRIECVRRDTADRPDVEAVVCAADARLEPGAGVVGAIHRAAGPGPAEEYRAILELADERGPTSVATPALSMGVFDYPVREAAEVAMGAVAAAAPRLRAVRLVRFVLWDEQDLRVHIEAMEA